MGVLIVISSAIFQVHNKMVTRLLKAPLSFHAVNPVGRVINRFSQDMNNLDELLPFYIFMVCHYAAPAVATILLAAITTPLLIIPVLLALPIFYFFSKVYFTSATDIKRLMSVASSPIYSHFSNTLEGLRNIRVYGRQKDFTNQVFRFAFLTFCISFYSGSWFVGVSFINSWSVGLYVSFGNQLNSWLSKFRSCSSWLISWFTI